MVRIGYRVKNSIPPILDQNIQMFPIRPIYDGDIGQFVAWVS